MPLGSVEEAEDGGLKLTPFAGPICEVKDGGLAVEDARLSGEVANKALKSPESEELKTDDVVDAINVMARKIRLCQNKTIKTPVKNC